LSDLNRQLKSMAGGFRRFLTASLAPSAAMGGHNSCGCVRCAIGTMSRQYVSAARSSYWQLLRFGEVARVRAWVDMVRDMLAWASGGQRIADKSLGAAPGRRRHLDALCPLNRAHTCLMLAVAPEAPLASPPRSN